MAPKEPTNTTQPLPFGAMERPEGSSPARKPRKKRASKASASSASSGDASPSSASSSHAPSNRESSAESGEAKAAASAPTGGESSDSKDYRSQEKRRGNSRRGGRRRRRKKPEGAEAEGGAQQAPAANGALPREGRERTREGEDRAREGDAPRSRRRRGRGRNRNRNRNEDAPEGGASQGQKAATKTAGELGVGMFVAEKGGYGSLRSEASQYMSTKQDIYVPQRLIQKFRLRDGSIVEGPTSKGKKHKFQLDDVRTVDGESPKSLANLKPFKNLTTIDPDFHYQVGDVTDDVSMRILDIISPVGRGQRGLVVAQPRTGKTTLMRQFAKGIEEGYPEVHLFVLLVDERPEEATDWVRSTGGKVFVSTSDESPKNHVQLAEAVWRRCQRLVELGEDVVLIMDSITRLARAYNNFSSGSGRTMSGGLDSRAMERPRQIFGSARNTETAGSLTILATALIDTGSKMDQLIFEEFKGTGNMEVMLNRKLSDRRIFPSIDIEKSGTRKEEKLISSRKLKLINTLRRVLLRMNFIEAMELLTAKLEDVEKTEDFLVRFEVDPEA